jgi:hypothetical protein
MPRLLSPYENTESAAALNARGQITRKQFEMLIDIDVPPTIAGIRRSKYLALLVALLFIIWMLLYWSAGQSAPFLSETVVWSGAALLVLNGALFFMLVLRWLYGIIAITPTMDDIASTLRERIRDEALGIQHVQGRLRFRHLARWQGAMVCEVRIGQRWFVISQQLWEQLQQQPGHQTYAAYYLISPFALLSIIPLDQLPAVEGEMVTDEQSVSGRTHAQRP